MTSLSLASYLAFLLCSRACKRGKTIYIENSSSKLIKLNDLSPRSYMYQGAVLEVNAIFLTVKA